MEKLHLTFLEYVAMKPGSFFLLFLVLATLSASTQAQPSPSFLDYIKARAAERRAGDTPPLSLKDWQKLRQRIRARLRNAWGGFPQQRAPLNPAILGTLERDGYRIEKVIFQTLPDVWMTANAYVPNQPGKRPAVLCVHGHWRGAKQDPVVQARCIGLAKLGFFVLAVDAFGAGERATGKALGEYHGEMTAATLLPLGMPLSGLQVYENSRAVDYLLTRPEVDGTRIGITGASGGGNQTMYAGAWDERFKAVVPVCSVGNYQAYLGAACCLCELVPGALEFTEEGNLLGLVAPRALLVINATQDAFQFSVAEAQKSLAQASSLYRLFGKPEQVRHTIFESPHDYSKPMREAMYGWMTLHLKEEGDGSPIPEPEIQTEDPEALRCYPGSSRPDDWMTLPKFAAKQGRLLLQGRNAEAPDWIRRAAFLRKRLDQVVLGGTKPALSMKSHNGSAPAESMTIEPEPGIRLSLARSEAGALRRAGVVLVLQMQGDAHPEERALITSLEQTGRAVFTLSLRATGKNAIPGDAIGRAPDHNSAEWAMWLGRPLLGQWVCDARAALDRLASEGKSAPEITVAGAGPAGIVALCAAALDTRIKEVIAASSLVSYLSEAPYAGQRLGIMAPGIVREVGDIAQIAALVAPRKLILAGGVDGAGNRLDEAALQRAFDFTRTVYVARQAAQALILRSSADLSGLK